MLSCSKEKQLVILRRKRLNSENQLLMKSGEMLVEQGLGCVFGNGSWDTAELASLGNNHLFYGDGQSVGYFWIRNLLLPPLSLMPMKVEAESTQLAAAAEIHLYNLIFQGNSAKSSRKTTSVSL